MPRPRSFDTAKVRVAIRDTFWKRGFRDASLHDLASETGVLPGSLHAAFGDKNALFKVALDEYDRHFEKVRETGLKGRAAIAAYLERLIAAIVADEDAKGCLIMRASADQELLSEDARRFVARRIALMRAFFAERLAEEGIEDIGLGEALFGTAIAVLMLGRMRPDETVLRELAKTVLQRLDLAGAERARRQPA
jgi:TetR/AcrR family transcriptional regulator, transcriptional repressor for nem operon